MGLEWAFGWAFACNGAVPSSGLEYPNSSGPPEGQHVILGRRGRFSFINPKLKRRCIVIGCRRHPTAVFVLGNLAFDAVNFIIEFPGEKIQSRLLPSRAVASPLSSLRQKLDSPRQADRRLGQSNAQKRLFDRPGLFTFWRNDIIIAIRNRARPEVATVEVQQLGSCALVGMRNEQTR